MYGFGTAAQRTDERALPTAKVWPRVEVTVAAAVWEFG